MTPIETTVLHQLGTDLVRTFVAIVVHTFTLTLYAIVAFKAVRVLRQLGHTKVASITLAIVITMFLSAFVLWCLDVTNFIIEAKVTLLESPDTALDEKYRLAQKIIFRHLVATDLLYAFMCNLGDAIIIWRVHALWRQDAYKWVLVVPWAMLVGSIVVSLLLTYCGARVGADIVDGSFQKPLFCKGIQTASYSMSFVTTAVATILIGIKTWQYRRTIRPAILQEKDGRSSPIEKILVLLVESGILYLLFFLVQVIGNIPGVEAKNASSFAFLVYAYSTSVIVGFYPTVVVVLAHSQHRVLDTAAASEVTSWRAATVKSPTQTVESGVWLSQGRKSHRSDIEIHLNSVTTTSFSRSDKDLGDAPIAEAF